MGKTLAVEVPRQFDSWIAGATALTTRAISRKAQWEEAGREFFRYTQVFVHVISGRLRDSGRFQLTATGNWTEVVVTYGDDQVRYAQTEIDRGPEHDFLGRAWEASQATFETTFRGTWARVVKEWRVI